MRTFSTVFLALASFHALTGLAAPTVWSVPEPVPEPAKPKSGCIVPQVIFSSLKTKFSLTALISGNSYGPSVGRSWPVQVSPRIPDATTAVKPIISRTRIAQPLFELKNGKLIYEGFPAMQQLSIAIFPPVLQSFAWGGVELTPGDGTLEFYAAYGCDAQGKQILELFDGLPGTDFVVRKVSEGKQILLKLPENQDDATPVRLQINKN
ncbi:MAG: hypothetical protein M1815_004571 [Lichina confinis]|nr:MAG: hypothetical protein M1815_004571 [Lichina confinis]